MCPAPQGWQEVYQDSEIVQCIPLFLETDSRHYANMNQEYCRDKIDARCMWLWRRTNINWTSETDVRQYGIALAFHLWRPRYSNEDVIEERYCVCLFLGNALNDPNEYLNELLAAVVAFRDDFDASHRFYITKTARYRYPPRINAAFNAIVGRLRSRSNAPKEFGWPEREVWAVVDWPVSAVAAPPTE